MIGIGTPGTWGVWELDLRPSNGFQGTPIIKRLVLVTEGGLLSGMDILPDKPTTVLVADSTVGVVWIVDTLTHTYKLAISNPDMFHVPWSASAFGIDAIHVHNGYLYWTNSYEATIFRLPITSDGYPADSEASSEFVVWVRSIYLDNFAFGPLGNETIWAASNGGNQLVAITPSGNYSFVSGWPDQLELAGPVAMEFGKLEGDTSTLYVCTGGGGLNPINGTLTEGGKLVAFDATEYFKAM